MNPLALLIALIPSSLAVIVWLNPWSSLVALLAWLIIAAVAGWLSRLRWPVVIGLLIAALTAGVSMALYGKRSGEVFWAWGPAVVSEGSLDIAAATAIRVLALAVPALLVFQAIDLTRLADALEQNLGWSPRFVWGSFAGLRQLELAQTDWQVVSYARRARGLSRGAIFARLFAMFAVAVERGGELALTMEARGLRATGRVPSRGSRWQLGDSVLVAGGVLLGLLIAVIAVLTGGSHAA